MALDESMSSSKHEMTPMKLKADFRENYAAAEGGGGGGGRCSVEIGQENLIALLLKQQEDMLRELKKQKKVLCVLVFHDFGWLFSPYGRPFKLKYCTTGLLASMYGYNASRGFNYKNNTTKRIQLHTPYIQ